MARARARDPIEELVDVTLPASWADELAAELTTKWQNAARRRAASGTIRRIGAALEPRFRACLGDPEPPRVRLRALAGRLVRATTAEREAKRQLEAAAERLLAPGLARAEREAAAALEELEIEDALGGDARRLHARAVRMHHDFVDGFEEVIEDEACALGTALMIYWRTSPHWFRQWARRSEVPSWGWNRQRWDLLRRIERRAATPPERDGLRHLGVAFDPRTWKPPRSWRAVDLTGDAYRSYPRCTEIPASLLICTTATGIEPLAAPRTDRRRDR